MNQVLITGGAGFIGAHTANALVRDGWRVRVLDCLDPQVHGKGARFPAHIDARVQCIRGDVRNTEDVERALAGVDTVLHLASSTGVGQSMYELRSYVDNNCTGTATLLQALLRRQQNTRRIVLASSRAVYGEGTHWCEQHGEVFPGPRTRARLDLGLFRVCCPECGGPVQRRPTAEIRPLAPGSVYAWSKQQQEEQCAYAARTFGLPVTVLRYFNVYGPRQSLSNPYTGVVSIFFSRLMAGQPISLYEGGGAVRDFVHVTDVVQANVAALRTDVEPGNTINVGTGTPKTIQQVAVMLARVAGLELVLRDEGEFRVGDVDCCFADVMRAREVLDYAPTIDLEQGLGDFVNWAKRQPVHDLYLKSVEELERHGLFGRQRTNRTTKAIESPVGCLRTRTPRARTASEATR